MANRKCAQCGKSFPAERRTAKYCSSTCRSRSSKQRKREARKGEDAKPPVKPAVDQNGEPLGLVESVKTELKAAGKLSAVLGQQAVALATQMTSEDETGASLAALSRELRSVMQQATIGGESGDGVDELQRKRDEKREAAARTS